MPKSHELQLMLVNTLRKVNLRIVVLTVTSRKIKDMEALDVGRICLALDVLIQDPSEDVIPAIRDRLHDLLSHNSSVGTVAIALLRTSEQILDCMCGDVLCWHFALLARLKLIS